MVAEEVREDIVDQTTDNLDHQEIAQLGSIASINFTHLSKIKSIVSRLSLPSTKHYSSVRLLHV